MEVMSESEDDMPLAQRARPVDDSEDDEDDQPLASRQAALKPDDNVTAATNGHHENSRSNGNLATIGASKPAGTLNNDESSSDDDVPLGKSNSS